MLFSALTGSLIVLWRLRLRRPKDAMERHALARKRRRALAVAGGVLTIYLVEVVVFALGASAISFH